MTASHNLSAIYHAMTMAIAPKGTPAIGAEYQFWRARAVKAYAALEVAGYDVVPAASVQFYRWDEETQRLVRWRKKLRKGAGLLRDADRAPKNDCRVAGPVCGQSRDDETG